MIFLVFILLNILHSPSVSQQSEDGKHEFVPADLEEIVIYCQFVAILAFVYFADNSMNDIITALNMFPNFEKAQPEDNVLGMILASSFRLLQGLIACVASMFLIVTAPDLKDLVLNFAALNFISGLDEVAFSSAILGDYGDSIRVEAQKVMQNRVDFLWY